MAQIHGGADLHAHTTASDGSLSPAQVVQRALQVGLEALAITDHDTIDGVAEAMTAATGHPVELVAGIEISCRIRNREAHLLGLLVDPQSVPLRRLAGTLRAARHDRAEIIVARARKQRLPLHLDAVLSIAAGAPVGRPHVATALVQAGVVSDVASAFATYLGIGRPLFVPKQLPPASEAITAVHGAGGAAVIAHPGSSRIRESLLVELVDGGLDGIEVRHPRHGAQRERILLGLCTRLGLLPCGGSDFHGPGRGDSQLGQYRVPLRWHLALRQRAGRYRDTRRPS